MPLDPRTTPDGEGVKAYTLTFGNEAGKMVLADLTDYVDVLLGKIQDDQGRTDPLKLAAADGARRMLQRIRSVPSLPAHPEWQALEKQRRLQLAASKLEKANG